MPVSPPLLSSLSQKKRPRKLPKKKQPANSTQNSIKEDDAKEDKYSDFEVIEGEDSEDSSNE
jgi:hypothetical protein